MEWGDTGSQASSRNSLPGAQALVKALFIFCRRFSYSVSTTGQNPTLCSHCFVLTIGHDLQPENTLSIV